MGNPAAALLLEERERILNEWERRVRLTIPPARAEERLALRNSLPEVLDGMAAMLSDPNPERVLSSRETRLAEGHGKHRAKNADYSLEQVVNEYHVLRKVLFDVLEEGDRELSRRDRDLLWDMIFISIKTAASEFTQVRDEEKKHMTRALESANTTLHEAFGAKAAEAVLKSKMLETIFERVLDYAMFTLDAEGRVSSWGEGAHRMKRYTKEDVLGRHYSMLYPEEGRIRREPQSHLEVAARQGRFRGEGLRQRKDGELFLADVFITPMLEGSELVGYFKVVADLTERNRVIQERDLTRTRVESLELESELRERFVSTLTHDLRTPLSTARISAQRITRQSCSVDQHGDDSRRALQNIDRVDRMVGDLLDVSRIKAAEPMSLEIAEYELVKDVQATCEELAIAYGDRFPVIAPKAVGVAWDRHAMKRVLENLLVNAAKYGDPNAPISTRLEEVEGRILIRIHNEGSPISHADQESLFDLFRRAPSAASGGQQGWGLGLTLVRGITEAHRGIVTVRSLPSEGTTFILDLPKDVRGGGTQYAPPPRSDD